MVDHAPRWLNEGLAEYFELSRLVGGRWRDGGIQDVHVALLQSGDHLVPLSEFLAIGPRRFYSRAQLHYAQGWALVHFLLEGGEAERKRFDTLLDALVEGLGTAEALERAFPQKDLPALERAFRAHVGGL